MGLNYVVLSGEVVSSPEKKHTFEGTPVTTFNLSFNNSFDDNSDLKNASIKVSAVKKLADKILNEVRSGDLVLVEGRLYTRVIENKFGQKQKLPYIHAANVKTVKSGEKQPVNHEFSQNFESEKDHDEEIPF